MENTALKITYGDLHLGVAGEGFEYIFAYHKGGPVSIKKDDVEWMYRSPVPALWRPLTDNDRGSGFHLRSGMWLAADTFIRVKGASVSVDGKDIPLPIGPENNKYSDNETAEKIKITHVFETITIPATCIEVSYTVTAGGRITVHCMFHGNKDLPELPVFGLRMVMPTVLSGETYPDRMAGAAHGTYEVQGLPMSGYLVPQECGMHMNTDRLRIYRNTSLSNVNGSDRESEFVIEKKDRPFAFTALPYTPGEIENADHIEALPLPRRTVLTVYGAVRGIGGIDSWGSDVEDAYHVSAGEDISFSFVIA